MCGVCEAEANKELPISVAAAASAVLDATFLVEGEHVIRFRPEGIGRQGQLNNVRIVPLVRPRGDFCFAPIHAYALMINTAKGDGPFSCRVRKSSLPFFSAGQSNNHPTLERSVPITGPSE
jgi:hypothetical protein